MDVFGQSTNAPSCNGVIGSNSANECFGIVTLNGVVMRGIPERIAGRFSALRSSALRASMHLLLPRYGKRFWRTQPGTCKLPQLGFVVRPAGVAGTSSARFARHRQGVGKAVRLGQAYDLSPVPERVVHPGLPPGTIRTEKQPGHRGQSWMATCP